MDKQIQFTVIENGQKHRIKTTHGAYRSLMQLINDQIYPEGFGECGGLGRCATCLVKTSGIKGATLIQERNEPATLSKLDQSNADLRLSCQLMITADLNDSVIEIVES